MDVRQRLRPSCSETHPARAPLGFGSLEDGLPAGLAAFLLTGCRGLGPGLSQRCSHSCVRRKMPPIRQGGFAVDSGSARKRMDGLARSGDSPVVEADQTTETRTADDFAARGRAGRLGRLNDLPVEPLMRPFPMVVRQIRVQHASYLPLVEENEVIEGFRFRRENPSLGVRIQIWRPGRELCRLDARGGDDVVERRGSCRSRWSLPAVPWLLGPSRCARLASRSWSRYLAPSSGPSKASVRLRATCCIHASCGCSVMPPSTTR